MNIPNIKYIDEAEISNKRVIMRVDFNVSLNKSDNTIANDARITQAIPTIEHLLRNKNKLILVSHLGRPKGRDSKLSLAQVAQRLEELLAGDQKVRLVDDFLTQEGQEACKNQTDGEILMLENIRFYPEEKKPLNDDFAKKLAALADIYINDAFGVSHRAHTSVVAIPKFIPGYGGLLLKKEVKTIAEALSNPRRPLTAIIGGAKISTKIELIKKLMNFADHILIGGGLANTFINAQGFEVGKSICEYERIDTARRILFQAAQKNSAIHLPSDVVIGSVDPDKNDSCVKKVQDITEDDEMILDIGPETQARYGSIIAKSNTIVWNGPMGYFEKEDFKRGTDFVYYSIANNQEAQTIVGGGDTLAAISKKQYLDSIDHISTGGGAMLEFIELGTLPGIEALES